MKKIVIFTQNLSFGGIQKVVSKLVTYLTKYYHISIILGESDKGIEQYISKNIDIQCIKTISIDINEKGIGDWLMNYRVNKLDNLLEIIQPNLLFSFGEYNNIIALKTKYKCKKIISLRAVFESMKAKKIHLINYLEYEKLMKKYYPLADNIITVSNYIAKEVTEMISNVQISTIYNGIGKDEVDTPCELIPPRYKYILNIGRLHPQKGQIDLLEAFSLIKDKLAHNLLIIGEGDNRAILEKRIEELSLKSRVFLLGEIANPYVFIKQCELFIFPSYYEGFPNTLIEAMACRVPIISYKFQGYDEILDEDNNLCKIGDIRALSEKIYYFLNSPIEKENLSKKLYNKSKSFVLKETLKQYHDEIKKVLN